MKGPESKPKFVRQAGPFKLARGFTITELMMAVAVVAILTSIAVPSYKAAMAKSDRSVAISDINQISLTQGRFFSANRVYTDDFNDLNMAGTANTSTISDSKGYYNYTLSVTAAASSYTVVASVNGSRDQWDLRLDDKGIRSKKLSSGSTWVADWP